MSTNFPFFLVQLLLHVLCGCLKIAWCSPSGWPLCCGVRNWSSHHISWFNVVLTPTEVYLALWPCRSSFISNYTLMTFYGPNHWWVVLLNIKVIVAQIQHIFRLWSSGNCLHRLVCGTNYDWALGSSILVIRVSFGQLCGSMSSMILETPMGWTPFIGKGYLFQRAGVLITSYLS